jgi:hypothetical protein
VIDIERQKRVVEDLLDDYERSLLTYEGWWRGWRARQGAAGEPVDPDTGELLGDGE